MRKILTLAAVVALAGCGGGGGSAPAPSNQQPTTPVSPQSNYVKPTFQITIPARGKSSSKARQPKFVSSTTTTVTVSLTADSAGVTVGSITGNPVSTTVTPPCSPCTVAGPPSPPGTDSFLVVTSDSATSKTLDAGVLTGVMITAGQANSETLTLGGIPASLALSGVPSWTAGTQSQTTTLSVIAYDGDSNQITSGTTPYVDATGAAVTITVSDPDTNAHGTCLVTSGTSTCTGGAATSETLTTASGSTVFDYDGLAENPITLTASASNGATSATAQFQPTLNAPVFNGSVATPSGVALSGSAEIDLFATSGIGSTGTESFTESGWTNSVYNHALTQTAGSCLSGTGYVATTLAGIATMSVGTNDTTNGTPFTATIASSPSAGSCADTISDGLSSNLTDGSATLTVTYTTTGVGVSSKHRRN
jgi:hypothetical protein